MQNFNITEQKLKLIAINEAAKMLNVSMATLRRWDSNGKLKSIRTGAKGRRMYSVEEVMTLATHGWTEGSSQENKPRVVFYGGKEGLMQAYEDTLTATGEILAYSSSHDMFVALPDYIQDYINRRAKKGIPMRSIIPHTPEGWQHREKALTELRDTRLIPLRFNFTPEINIYNDKIAIMNLKLGELGAFIIESKEIAEAQRNIFELAWETAGKYDRWEIEAGSVHVTYGRNRVGKPTLKDVTSHNVIVERRITQEELDSRFSEGIEKGVLQSEQWFRRPENWYAITAYANPYKTVYGELAILNKNERAIAELLNERTLIFYGVGTGDTEMLPILWQLQKNNYSEVVGIDVEEHFIYGFVQSLRNLNLDSSEYQIQFLGYGELIQYMRRDDFELSGGRFARQAHICFGNTVGNFDQKEIFKIFQKNTARGDYLVLGYQLAEHIDHLLSQYQKNMRFERLIFDALSLGTKERVRAFDPSKLQWRYSTQESRIEAWYEQLLVFQSRKYDLKTMEDYVVGFDLKLIKHFAVPGFAISVFERV